MLKLNIVKRDSKSNLDKLRATGFIPAVFYGRKEKSTSISVNAKEFFQVYKKAGESAVITLVLDGVNHNALIHDYNRDPLTQDFVHIDFYVVEKGAKIEVAVPLNFIGVAPAEKLGGALVKVLHEVDIKAEADKLPEHIDVDLSSLLDFDARITVADLKAPAGVEIDTDKEQIVALVNETKEEVEEVAPVDVANIGLSVEKGKKDEEVVESK